MENRHSFFLRWRWSFAKCFFEIDISREIFDIKFLISTAWRFWSIGGGENKSQCLLLLLPLWLLFIFWTWLCCFYTTLCIRNCIAIKCMTKWKRNHGMYMTSSWIWFFLLICVSSIWGCGCRLHEMGSCTW